MNNITNKTKTILFASLIAAMILPFSGMGIADAAPNENASDKVLERNWSNTDKQLKNDAAFKAYSVEDFSTYNDWTERLQQENIRNFNIETKIGHEVDGYELVALFAKKDILTNQYQPTETERFVNDWAFTVYDLPNNVSAINQRINEIAGNGNIHLAEQLVESINVMTNQGSVSPEIHDLDNEYWNLVIGKITCSENPNCDMSWLEPDRQGLALIQQVGSFTNHWSTITLEFDPCEATVQTCYATKDNNGSGNDSVELSPTNIHIQDAWIDTEMSAWGTYGSIVFVSGQVTASLTGDMKYKSATTNVFKSTNLQNPNSVNETQPTITFTSYAWIS